VLPPHLSIPSAFSAPSAVNSAKLRPNPPNPSPGAPPIGNPLPPRAECCIITRMTTRHLHTLRALRVLRGELHTPQRPDKQGRQVGGQKTWRTWRPWLGDLKNTLPPTSLRQNVQITKMIIRGVAKNDRLDRLRLAGPKTRFVPARSPLPYPRERTGTGTAGERFARSKREWRGASPRFFPRRPGTDLEGRKTWFLRKS
jgi:hypothetical protein